MKKKQEFTIKIISLIILGIIGMYFYTNLNDYVIKNKQNIVLNYPIPLITSEREVMMKETERGMNFIDYFNFNNPQQLLIRRFLEVPLK